MDQGQEIKASRAPAGSIRRVTAAASGHGVGEDMKPEPIKAEGDRAGESR